MMFATNTDLALTISATAILLLNAIAYYNQTRYGKNVEEAAIYKRIIIETIWLVFFSLMISGMAIYIPIAFYIIAKLFISLYPALY